MIPLLLLAATLGGVPVEIRPAEPTVGDRIEIRFPEEERGTITIEKSNDYEIVRSGATSALVRSFRPGPVTVRGRVDGSNGSFGFRELKVNVTSVLAEDDSLEPAPYRPPQELPTNRAAWWAIGLAALAAIALWTAVFRAREAAPTAAPAAARLAPRAEYLAELRRARVLDLHPGIVVIAGAMRRFLARVHPSWGLELTSRELRRELRRHRVRNDIATTVDQVLLEADLEKFSPWGAPEVDKNALIDGAERLVDLDHGTAGTDAEGS